MRPEPRRRTRSRSGRPMRARRSRRSRTNGAPIGSLRLAVKIGNAFSRSLPSASISESMPPGRLPGPEPDRTPAPRPLGPAASAFAPPGDRAAPSPASTGRRAAAAPARARARRCQAGGGVGEELTRVVETAVDQVLPEPVTGHGGQGAPAPQLQVRLIVAWQHGELNVAGAADRNDLLQTVGPVAAAAEQAQYHQARAADHLLDIQVDRHRMAELQEIGEAQARAYRAVVWPGPRRDRPARCRRPTGTRCRPASGRGRSPRRHPPASPTEP